MNLLSLVAQTSNDIYPVDMSNIATDSVILAIVTFFIGIVVVTYAIVAYLLGRIFTKAGIPAWKAWVPVYSTWTTLELGGQAGWFSVLLLSPTVANIVSYLAPGSDAIVTLLFVIAALLVIVATVYLYIAMYKIGLHFGKEGYFVLWAIFLPIVWYAWLAFDQSTWKESAIMAKFGQPDAKSDDSHSS